MNRKLIFIIVFVILTYLLVLIYSNTLSERVRNETNQDFRTSLGLKEEGKRFLLMFAHPDDETMFFTPTLTALTEGGADIHFLCLSAGDHKNLGIKRIKEMFEVASCLNIPKEHVKISHYQDKPGLKWSPLDVSKTLNKYVQKWGIETVITFDRQGVSGHANHISCYDAITHYKSQNPSVECYVLNSVGKKRRYLGALGNYRLENSITAVSNSARKALFLMKNHHSQNTWWRKLHIALSSHTYVNTLIKL
jgi:N-acetylglucosaminylphosphatidylinositol deacetylase